MTLEICLKPLSPLCLVTGAANVNIDADIAHDKRGLPYFPARRLKGLLYESALELAEMAELSGLDFVTRRTVEELFGHAAASPVRLVLEDLYLPNYGETAKEWDYLQNKYAKLLRPEDVLEAYSSLRSQTALENGVAKEHSLRTFRVLDAMPGVYFVGAAQIFQGETRHKNAFVLAMQNLSRAGMNRNRGMGRLVCSLTDEGEQRRIVEEVLEAAS